MHLDLRILAVVIPPDGVDPLLCVVLHDEAQKKAVNQKLKDFLTFRLRGKQIHKIPVTMEPDEENHHMVDDPVTINDVMERGVPMEEFVGTLPQEVQELLQFIQSLQYSHPEDNGKTI
tara:strand:- start:283 stop:636 length:354 start_codon:yes stop_codon:yes gene_type:complete